MAYKIKDDRIGCGSCQGDCPVGAIVEGGAAFTIDASQCIDCGACTASCPVDAIVEA
ncbi:MAG: 4Fe-4S binding protein [Firmicutes bacterium]|nr:4Fe-4S binding protein [Bacillota bacterium]